MIALLSASLFALGALVTEAGASEFTAAELFGVRAGHGAGRMRIVFDPMLIDLFGVAPEDDILLLDPWHGGGTVSVYASDGKFIRRFQVLRPGERPNPRKAMVLLVDRENATYVKFPAPDFNLRKFDREGRFARDYDVGWVDLRGHLFGRPTVDTLEERDANWQLLQSWTGTRDVAVDARGGLVATSETAPPDVPRWRALPGDRGPLFRDRQGYYYRNLNNGTGVCADFLKLSPTGELVWRLLHVDLMKKLGYRHREHEWIPGPGPYTRGGRFCTLGWYLSMRDEIYALAASDSVPRNVPWLRIIRVQVKDK